MTVDGNVGGGGGWSEQPNGGECRSDGRVSQGNRTHNEDWNAAALNTAWIRDATEQGASHAQPFYIYQGMNIVHPPYLTTQHWYDKIADNLTVPEWQPLSEMHPCGLQSSMLKGCIPTAEGSDDFYSIERRRNVRRVYLAMIAEFDAMVGECTLHAHMRFGLLRLAQETWTCLHKSRRRLCAGYDGVCVWLRRCDGGG